MEVEPDFGLAQFNVALTYEEGNPSEAIEWYERAVASSGGALYIKGQFGAMLTRMGESERATRIMTELRAAVSDGRPAFVSIAQI
ncbi:MAG: hypothetical protein V3T28_07185 [Gemmatimonadales bacterium]